MLGLEDVILETSVEWSAKHPGHRQMLRQALWDRIPEQLRADLAEPEFLNLEKPPHASLFTCSIAHCGTMGGFVFSLTNRYQLGFDLEDESRADAAVVKRISTTQEMDQAPSPAHLWVAKEATFKSLLGPLQPNVLSQIQVHNWRHVSDANWLFSSEIQSLGGRSLNGAIEKRSHLILGLTCFSA